MINFRGQRSEVRGQRSDFLCLLFSVFCSLSSVLCLLSSVGFAQSLSSTELISNAKGYDGKAVIYSGEVIGDIMPRGGYAWVNINDGENALGIWADKDLIKDIFYGGTYKIIGDRVEVTGIFHRACLEHGGDLDIHAQAIRKISSGRKIPERLNLDKKNLIIILLGILCLIWILSLFKRR